MAKRFIKLAVDDTATTALWSWEAEAFFPRLLRLCFPTGQIDCGKKPPAFVLSKWTRWPEEIIEVALEELIGCGTVEATGGALCIPNMRSYHFGKGRPPGPTTAGQDGRPANNPDPINANKSTYENSSLSLSSSLVVVAEQAGAREAADPLWVEVARVCDGIPWVEAPSGLRALRTPRDRIYKQLAAGATADEMLAVLRGLSAAITAGKEPRTSWDPQYIFSGYYDRLRNLYAGGEAAVVESAVERLKRLEGGT